MFVFLRFPCANGTMYTAKSLILHSSGWWAHNHHSCETIYWWMEDIVTGKAICLYSITQYLLFILIETNDVRNMVVVSNLYLCISFLWIYIRNIHELVLLFYIYGEYSKHSISYFHYRCYVNMDDTKYPQIIAERQYWYYYNWYICTCVHFRQFSRWYLNK